MPMIKTTVLFVNAPLRKYKQNILFNLEKEICLLVIILVVNKLGKLRVEKSAIFAKIAENGRNRPKMAKNGPKWRTEKMLRIGTKTE